MRIEWTAAALKDFEAAQEFIAQDSPSAARQVAQRVHHALSVIKEHGEIGGPGHVAGTREWTVKGTQYLVVYRVGAEAIEVLRLWHGRQNWKASTTS